MTYETDIIAWANEQVALLRAGKLDQIDVGHISDAERLHWRSFWRIDHDQEDQGF